ncbi:MAG: outer membrane lipoprotein carrier protein LolA [Halorientalis sp.]
MVLAVVVLVAAAVVTAIVLVPSSADAPTNRSLFGDHASEQIRTLDGINATVETVIERENGTSRSVERVSLRPGTGDLRAVRRSGSEYLWDRRVSNGTVLWLYDSHRNEVETIDHATVETTRTAHLDRLFHRLARTRTPSTPETPMPGIRPLPALPRPQQHLFSQQSSGRFGVTYVGNRTVSGRETYLVRLQTHATGDAVMVHNYTQRLWLDSQYFYPLKRRTSWRQNGSRTVITTTFRNVTFDPGLSDSLFAFDPPANTTVDGPTEQRQTTYGSITALQSATSMSVPIPTIPDSFGLVSASRTNVPGRVRSVGLVYVNSTSKLSIAKTNLTWYHPRTDSEPVTIGNQHGEFRNLGPEQVVSWTCGNWRYSVSGRGISKSLLVDVAKSVSCE